MRLAAGASRLDVDPADGGRWTSLVVQGLELLSGTDRPGTPPAVRSGCFAMAPYAGRVRDARLPRDGTAYSLPAVDPPHAMHGLVLDRPWSTVSAGADRLVLTVEVDARWPWRATVRQELLLTADGLDARLVLTAGEPQPAWIGWHPWLRRRLATGDAVRVDLAARQQHVKGADGLPTGELVARRPGPHDDCFEGVDGPVRLTWEGALELTLSSSTTTWVLFDELPDVLCVEPQTGPPDAYTLGVAAELAVGEELGCTLSLRWRPLGARA